MTTINPESNNNRGDVIQSKLDNAMNEAYGTAKILQLEEYDVKLYSEREIRVIRNSHGALKVARKALIEVRIGELKHISDFERLVSCHGDSKNFKRKFKLSTSIAKAKASCYTHLLNGNDELARTSLNRLKEKYGEAMENTLESNGNIIVSIVDGEHTERTSRDYTGIKDTENARRLGKTIMDNLNYIENCFKMFGKLKKKL